MWQGKAFCTLGRAWLSLKPLRGLSEGSEISVRIPIAGVSLRKFSHRGTVTYFQQQACALGRVAVDAEAGAVCGRRTDRRILTLIKPAGPLTQEL
jgi:hypothetical protein